MTILPVQSITAPSPPTFGPIATILDLSIRISFHIVLPVGVHGQDDPSLEQDGLLGLSRRNWGFRRVGLVEAQCPEYPNGSARGCRP